jgi:hypothetical protein
MFYLSQQEEKKGCLQTFQVENYLPVKPFETILICAAS